MNEKEYVYIVQKGFFDDEFGEWNTTVYGVYSDAGKAVEKVTSLAMNQIDYRKANIEKDLHDGVTIDLEYPSKFGHSVLKIRVSWPEEWEDFYDTEYHEKWVYYDVCKFLLDR